MEEIEWDPRWKPTIGNAIRAAFYPNGLARFSEGMNEDFQLGPMQSLVNLYISSYVDAGKTCLWFLYAKSLVSDYLLK